MGTFKELLPEALNILAYIYISIKPTLENNIICCIIYFYVMLLFTNHSSEQKP